MTIYDKISEIEMNFSYWMGHFSRKELVGNSIRIVGEAVCKAVILKIKGEPHGTSIILGNDLSFPRSRDAKLVGMELNFADLIKVVKQINGFRRSNGTEEQLLYVKSVTNFASHSNNDSADQLDQQKMDLLYANMSSILRWFFCDFMRQQLPDSIELALTNPEAHHEINNEEVLFANFLSLCRGFQPRSQYILVAPKEISSAHHIVESLTRLPWRLILDFNPKSDVEETGLLHNFNKKFGPEYKKAFTVDDKIEFDPKFQHYWFFANGQGTLPTYTSFNDWRRKYKRFLSEKLYKSFNNGSRQHPRVVVMIDISPEYANAIIDEFNAVDNDNLKFVLCNDGRYSYDAEISGFDNVKAIAISPQQLSNGINNSLVFQSKSVETGTILVPVRKDKGATSFVPVDPSDYNYLKSIGIELVYKGIEKEEKGDIPEDNFYKGGTISWSDLAEEKDIKRASYGAFSKYVQSELERNKTKEIELLHEAGAGGTTMARRLAFDVCVSFPTVILKQYESRRTISGLRLLYDKYTNSSLPFLIIVELFELKSVSSLYRDLGHANKNAVILVVNRGTTNGTTSKMALKATLQMPEVPLFENRFAQLIPEKRAAILDIKLQYRSTPQYISPFLFGLVTYETAFMGINEYVKKCLDDLSTEQRKLLGFICLIYHFTQRSVPGEFFTGLFSTTRDRCDLLNLLGEQNSVFDILHEDYDGNYGENTWRPRYALLGTETMKIILAGTSGQKNNWETYLSTWLIELIKTLKLAMPELHDEGKELLDSLFISRGDYDNEERDEFTDAIHAIKNRQAGVAVFEALTEAYPDEAHFHGHFARYLYKPQIEIKDYDRAIEEASLSLEIQENDSSLEHTLGMCYYYKTDRIIATMAALTTPGEDLEENVKDLVEQACIAFDRSIALDDHNVYGHVSQINLIIKALDFGFRLRGGTNKERFITNPENVWYENLLDKVGNLLDDAFYVISQSKGLENKLRLQRSMGYLEACESKYHIEMGESLLAKDKYEGLAKNPPSGYQFMVPRYRSLYVRCLLAFKSDNSRRFTYSWERLSEPELTQCVNFLRENIFVEPNNVYNIKLWLQAIRHLKVPPTIEECIEKVAIWTQNQEQPPNSRLEGWYYLYVLHAVKAISSGEGFDQTNVETVKQIKEKMKALPKNEKFSFEWYGKGSGIQKLKNHETLGEFNNNTFFSKNAHELVEVTGRIKESTISQSGKIILDCGLEAFFVPAVGHFTERNQHDRVKFYVGFRYDQISAWDVVPIDYDRNGKIAKTNEPKDQIETENSGLVLGDNEVPERKPIQYLPGIKLVDKINLTSIPQNGNKKVATEQVVPPTIGKVYEGKITELVKGKGIIEGVGLDRQVRLLHIHLRNEIFAKLKKGRKVKFKIIFKNESPQTDNDGKLYVAKEIFTYD